MAKESAAAASTGREKRPSAAAKPKPASRPTTASSKRGVKKESEPLPTAWLTSENSRLTSALAAAEKLGEVVIGENQVLESDARERDRDNYEVDHYLRTDLASLQKQLAAQQRSHAEAEREAADKMAEYQQATTETADELSAQTAATETQLRAQIAELEQKMASVAGFREQQGSIARETAFLRADRDKCKSEVVQQAAAHKEDIHALREKLLGEANDAAASLTAERLRKLDEALSDRATKLLQENIRLKAELKVHSDATDSLAGELKTVTEENQVLQRELKLSRQLEKQYASRSALQAREILAARKEAATAAAAVIRMKTQQADTIRTYQGRTAGEQDESYRTLDHSHEFSQLKEQLNQEVLQQRSDLETFLLSSIDMVRAEAGAGREDRQAPSAAAAAASDDELIDNLADPEFDIKNLSWEDREKVLRELFARLNDPTQQGHLTAHIAHAPAMSPSPVYGRHHAAVH